MRKLKTQQSREVSLGELLERVSQVRLVLEGCVQDGELERTLPAEAVAALAKSELFSLKVPRELGGFEALPSVEFHVLAALAEISSSAAWCTMVGNTGAALLGAYLSDEGCAEVFGGSTVPKAAGVAAPTGTATPVDGGHRISGRWRFASGIRHSDWLQVNAVAATPEREVVSFAVPTADVTIEDTWHVVGLRGTGSCDFRLEDYFVPHRRTFVRRPDDPTSRKRGGALFAMPRLSGVTYEHAGIAYGLGRRALALLQKATHPETGHPNLSSRDDVLGEIGRLGARLAAAGTWVATLHDGILGDLESGAQLDPAVVATTAQTSACLVTEVAADICAALFRYSGAQALYVPNEAERLFRDINAASQHVAVGNYVYLAQARIPFSRVERTP
ncbi:hypothetical protein [Streptomyces sp. NPDC029041]|uniref:hypothetical protein n=1 Tax=Streptomyces sp. NPDC029041 TaxID=3155727 RepID=UPI0034015ED9